MRMLLVGWHSFSGQFFDFYPEVKLPILFPLLKLLSLKLKYILSTGTNYPMLKSNGLSCQ